MAFALTLSVIGFRMVRRISSKSRHSSAGMSAGRWKRDLLARFSVEDVVFVGVMVVTGGLGANLAGVSVVFGRGAALTGVPIWQG